LGKYVFHADEVNGVDFFLVYEKFKFVQTVNSHDKTVFVVSHMFVVVF